MNHPVSARPRPRLTSTQFMALRSISKEAWDLRRGSVLWRFNGSWRRLHVDGHRDRAGDAEWRPTPGRAFEDPLFRQVALAAWDLEAMGLIELVTVRCCPNSSCNLNDRHGFKIGDRGSALLASANTSCLRSSPVVAPLPKPTPLRLQAWLRAAVNTLTGALPPTPKSQQHAARAARRQPNGLRP